MKMSSLKGPTLGVERSTAYIISAVGFFLILLPKINLIEIGNQSAGLRVDDFVISLIFSLFFFAMIRFRLLPIFAPSGAFYLLFCAYSVLATAFNIISFDNGSILYPIRLLEYFIFFVIGYNCPTESMLKFFLSSFLTMNVALSLLQYFGFVGGFSSEGFSAEASDRPFGTTGGPWELAGIANLVFVYFSFSDKNNKRWRNLLFAFSVTTFIILLTKSRIALVSQIVAIVLLLRYVGIRVSSFLLIAAFVGGFSYFAYIFDLFGGVTERSEGLFSLNNIYAFQDMYDGLGDAGSAIDFPQVEQLSDTDASWLLRVAKWTFAFKYWTSDSLYVAFGVGAGAWGVALDGGALRLITENGLIGLVLYGLFLFSAARQGAGSFALVAMLVVNMLMIDIYIAYKFMAVLLTLIGHNAREKIVI